VKELVKSGFQKKNEHLFESIPVKVRLRHPREIPQQNLCIVWKKPLDLMPMLEI